MNKLIVRIVWGVVLFCVLVGGWFVYSEIYISEAQLGVEKVVFEVKQDESVGELISRLESEQIIRNTWLFKKYIVLQGWDKKINYGEFEVEAPITTSRVAKSLSQPGISEMVITIIPGWTIRDFAYYLENQGIAQAEELTELIGLPARNYKIVREKAPNIDLDLPVLVDKPWYVSYEGYLAPETYRVYKNATVGEIVKKLIEYRDSQITEQMYKDIDRLGRTWFEVLTMASILEKEVNGLEDKKKVSDIFWRRYDMNWALQADSTVHYAVGKTGDVYTTQEDRDTNSPWNTYKYPGLPIGPISNPSLESIEAAIYPDKNNDWYFLTTVDGEVKYAETLEEHNQNKVDFLN